MRQAGKSRAGIIWVILLSLTGCFWIYAMWHNFRDGVVSGLGRFVL